MNKGFKGVCAAAISLTLLATTLTACGKRITPNANLQSYNTESNGSYSDGNFNNAAPVDDNNVNAIDTPTNSGSNGNANYGGSYSGGNSSGGNYSENPYIPPVTGSSNNENPVTYTSESNDLNNTTKRSSVFDKLKKEPTTKPKTTESTSRTTRPITSNPVNAQRVLNSAALNPMITNDAQLDELVNDLMTRYTNPGMSTYQKVCSIYDHFVMDNRYGFMPLKNSTSTYFSIYDADVVGRAKNFLIYKTGDCFDFSAAFMAVTRKIGLESYLINGQIVNKYGDTSIHGWTVIRINGVDYGFDPEADFRYANGKAPSYWNFCIDDPVKFKKIYTNFAVASFMNFKTF